MSFILGDQYSNTPLLQYSKFFSIYYFAIRLFFEQEGKNDTLEAKGTRHKLQGRKKWVKKDYSRTSFDIFLTHKDIFPILKNRSDHRALQPWRLGKVLRSSRQPNSKPDKLENRSTKYKMRNKSEILIFKYSKQWSSFKYILKQWT